MLFDVVQNI